MLGSALGVGGDLLLLLLLEHRALMECSEELCSEQLTHSTQGKQIRDV